VTLHVTPEFDSIRGFRDFLQAFWVSGFGLKKRLDKSV
jgi:hypothetical protein